eukprot:776375-Prymnesium_polylepis.2
MEVLSKVADGIKSLQLSPTLCKRKPSREPKRAVGAVPRLVMAAAPCPRRSIRRSSASNSAVCACRAARAPPSSSLQNSNGRPAEVVSLFASRLIPRALPLHGQAAVCAERLPREQLRSPARARWRGGGRRGRARLADVVQGARRAVRVGHDAHLDDLREHTRDVGRR